MEKVQKKANKEVQKSLAIGNKGETSQLVSKTPLMLKKSNANALAFGSIDNSVQKKDNQTGLPDNLKSGIEALSGHSMDDVKVHYNSAEPTQLNAHAFAQGSDIHVASGQEKHLPHEVWHVVQQKEGRVQPNRQMKGKVNINDDEGLEREADVMGEKALQMKGEENNNLGTAQTIQKFTDSNTVQCDNCQEVYSERTNLITDREGAKTRVRSNLNSWTPHLLSRLNEEVNTLFSTAQDLAWWANWATSLVIDLLDTTIAKPIGIAIKAMASVGEHIVGQSIAHARGQLVSAANRAIVDMQTSQRIEAESYIDEYFTTISSRTDGECSDYVQLLYDSIEQWWPPLSPSNYGQLGTLATQLLEQVRMRALEAQIERDYENCLRMNLERPAGIPSEEEQAQARADCRRETGYTPGR